MSGSLSAVLVAQAPREVSGATASNRFSYQHNWTICRILELHATATRYVVLCDYHEDVVVVSPSNHPENVACYQVKTEKNGKWTRARLVFRGKGKGKKTSSVLGKLITQRERLKPYEVTLHLVSNSAYDLDLSNGAKSDTRHTFSGANLSDAEKSAIAAKLNTELNRTDVELGPSFTFQVCPMGINGQDEYVKGRIVDFLEQLYPGRKFAVGPLYRVLFDGVRRAANTEGVFGEYEELVQKKGILRESIEELLRQHGSQGSLDALWVNAHSELISASVSLERRTRLQVEWRRYEIDRLDPSNAAVDQLRNRIIEESRTAIAEGNDIVSVLRIVREAVADCGTLFSVDYIEAATLMEIYEGNSVQEISPQFEKKAP